MARNRLVTSCIIAMVILTGCAKREPSQPENLSGTIRSVDANSDGVIDKDDVKILMVRANDYFDNRIQPFLEKAGIERSEEGHVLTKNVKDKLKNRLIVAEQRELEKAIREHNRLSAQVDATMKQAFPFLKKLTPEQRKVLEALGQSKAQKKDE